MKWSKVVVHVEDFPVTIYVNDSDTRALVFPVFGRYYGFWSDKSAVDLAISLIFLAPRKELTYIQYLSSQEDTSIIYQEAA